VRLAAARAMLVAAFLSLSVVTRAATAPAAEKGRTELPNIAAKKWTGDLDGMIKRRMIRVLVTYSQTQYFVDRGTQRGLTYDVFRAFEDDLNKKLKTKHLRVHVVFVPVSRGQLLPALVEGRGDIASAQLTITPERLEQVDFSAPIRRNVSEIIVTDPGSGPIGSVEDLSGREVFVRKSTSFYQSLEKLNSDFESRGKAPMKLRLAPDNLETEDLLEMVNAGLVNAVPADDFVAEFWQQVLPKIVLNRGAIRTGGEIGWAIRKRSSLLKAELDGFLARYPEGSLRRNQVLQKYLRSTKFVKEATSQAELAKFERTVEFFRKYGDRYDMDYLLMMAQGYQESRLDQNAKSAIGIMQVMPTTGRDMNVGNVREIEPNIHAGVKYIRFMVDQFYQNEPMDGLNKVLFAFASYNAGPGRIAQLRRLAATRGRDPNVWFDNVEVLASEKIGRETVTYVANIYKYYLAYKLVTEEEEERRKTREALRNGKP
jgi:membrane-bound lytic murein transglycosylase MltF